MIKELTLAVLAWFTAQNGSPWYECGKKYTPEQARVRAGEYARVVVEANRRHPYPDGAKWLLAMLAQESALDRCQIAGWCKRKLGMGRRPTEKQALKVLRGATYKHKIDGGPLQRLYPPHGKWYGPEKALDLQFQVELTARRLPMYLKQCRANYGPRKIWRSKYTRKRLRCADVAFTIHNTGGGINLKYYGSVSFQRRRWEKQLKRQEQRAALQDRHATAG